jgi:hypothetical protein
MKKAFTSIAIVFLAIQVSNAQTEKGTQSLGLNVGFNYTTNSSLSINPGNQAITTLDSKATGFNIGPNYSYFIKNNMDIGINFSYSVSNTTNTTENASTTNDSNPLKDFSSNYGAEVFIRKYCLYKNKIGFRTGAYLGYTGGNSTTSYGPSYTAYNYKSTSNYYFGGLNTDIVYYPSKKLGIAATLMNLQYQHYKVDRTTQGNDEGDAVNFSFINSNLSFSIFYIIGK